MKTIISSANLCNFFVQLHNQGIEQNSPLQLERFNQFIELFINILEKNIDRIGYYLKQLSASFDVSSDFNYDMMKSLMLLINNERNADIEISKRVSAEKSFKDKSTRKIRSIESPKNKFLRVNPDSPKKQSNTQVNRFLCDFTLIALRLTQILKDNGVADETLGPSSKG